MTGFSQSVRDIVLARAGGRCERCGHFTTGERSIHHRRRRGMGGVSGSRAETTNGASNALVLCGSGTTGCHGWAETHIPEAQAEGLVLMQHENPATVPVRLYVGKVWLRDDGDYAYAPGGDDE